MLNKLLHRSITHVESRLVLVPPPGASIPAACKNVEVDAGRRAQLVADAQRLRGSVYLRDGAVELHELTHDGLYRTPEDEESWHLLMLDNLGRVGGCIWYMDHDPSVSVERLRVRNSPLAHQPMWRDTLRSAVELELALARREGIGYAEAGGWAIAESGRSTSEGLVLALAAFSLGQVFGGTLGLATATVRHCSSTILRRLGGSLLTVGGRSVPSYHDPRYKCEMELLRFDSRYPSPKYHGFVELLKEKLFDVLVIAPQEQRQSLRVAS